jgi:hypothetical protein
VRQSGSCQIIAQLCHALSSALNPVQRTHVVKSTSNLIQATFGTVNRVHQGSSSPFLQPQHIVPHLRQVA